MTGPRPTLVVPFLPNSRVVHLVDRMEVKSTVRPRTNVVLTPPRPKWMARLLTPLMSPTAPPRLTLAKHGDLVGQVPWKVPLGPSRCRKAKIMLLVPKLCAGAKQLAARNPMPLCRRKAQVSLLPSTL